jgi:hypothetical protein
VSNPPGLSRQPPRGRPGGLLTPRCRCRDHSPNVRAICPPFARALSRACTLPRHTLPAPTIGSNLPPMVGAVIYVRVSTKEQTENLSLPTQLRACEEYCRRPRSTARRPFSTVVLSWLVRGRGTIRTSHCADSSVAISAAGRSRVVGRRAAMATTRTTTVSVSADR